MTRIPILEPDQEELLATLVEASRRVAREDRQKFFLIEVMNGAHIQHPGLANSIPGYRGDIEVLGREGLLLVAERQRNVLSFDVTPLGFKVYSEMKSREGEPIERLQAEVRSYFDGRVFQARYPLAYKKWSEAESLLWNSDMGPQLTTIGHLARESMQEFADVLAQRFELGEAGGSKADTVRRVRAVLSRKEGLGKTSKAFLDALLVYWGTVSDLVQRQEHGGQKEGEAITWEDARRTVFQAAIVMFEIDRALG